ncbi:zinc finger protein 62-like isoform X3 [Dreissena polymorpha]|nr:zinc finger protein 62-like isoform X3 [Dreissena polymorpha]XP_052227827.1 zinc finger protein 62-like isoform X3 [Dreissena polymorpha]
MDLPYKCSACNLYFKTLQEQEEHKQVKHPKEYQCKQCDRKYNYLLSLRQHMQVAHRKPCEQLRFECSVCGKSFPTKGRLKVHMVSHSSERPFTCDLCGLSFKSHDALKTHSMYIHEGLPRKPYVRKYTCEYCAVTFNSGTTLKEHILRKHTENAEFRHKCDICDQSFCRPVRLEAHKNKDHFNRKPYTCSHCNKGFFIEYDCKRHMSRCSKEKDRNKSTNEKDDQAAFNIDGKTHGTSTNVSISSSGYQIYPTNSIGIDPVHSQGSGQLSFVDLGGSSVMTSYLENSTNLANTVSVTCFQPVNTTYQDML